ncbi:dienelactone hydrolase family protein [Swingsia samuiensis]|uniref:Dienelactone hydrolase family protein n=1 Tax=Swingsia samuiensis TaxID=1293412 RepID=A0A4Y6UKI3_9PROT|nr:dienelactone hydrolase family protein [Swingsia samuiensis]QDH17584.1 dienelactone hydrolase family protein [Swingsia samuiensis]
MNTKKTQGRLVRLTTDDGHSFDAWEAGSAESQHSIIVIQEIFGLTDHIKTTCEELAQEGFHVIAPALFDRVKPNTVLNYDQHGIEEGLKYRAQITPEHLRKDIAACSKHLRQEDHNRKTGIIGFCWGGLIAWLEAVQTHQVNAAVSWYGRGISDYVEHAPHCPVQLHFGDQDHTIPHLDIQTIRQKRPEVEVFVYDNAGHGFGCRDRADFDKNARDLAWKRSVEFLRQNLA